MLPKINQQLSRLIHAEWFDIAHWHKQNAVTGQSKGRNITWFIGHENDEWVLRHYYRGGIVAKLLHDQYLYTGFENTRCYQELNLLEQMYQQDLPAPKPIAARVIKQGLFYRADILTEKIPHTENLAQRLRQENFSEADWHSVGALAARFHQSGIYHPDLNVHNILVDNDFKFWLIDFDKCDNRVGETSWKQANLARLERSFYKESQLHNEFHFSPLNWQWLLQGYNDFFHND